MPAYVCIKTEICRHFWYSQTEKNKVKYGYYHERKDEEHGLFIK